MEIKGTISKIYYERAGWAAVLVRSEDGKAVRVNGSVTGFSEGERIVVRGEMYEDPKYGMQLKAVSSESAGAKKKKGSGETKTKATGGKTAGEKASGSKGAVTMTRAETAKYLASGFIKGVGPALAERICEVFGNNTISVTEKEPDLLTAVPGITEKKAAEIAKCHRETKHMAELILLLSPDATPHMISLLYGKYGSKAAKTVRDNPYRLADEISGIGFKKADAIALASGMTPNDPRRVKAAVLFVIQSEAKQNGHSFLYPASIEANVKKLVGTANPKDTAAGIREHTEKGRLVTDKDNAVYPAELYAAEKGTAEAVARMLAEKPRKEVKEKDISPGLDENQKEAVRSALKSGLSVITGGPGTGKTTIVGEILRCADGLTSALAAPTGKAARRLSEATGREAKTIHALLEAAPDGRGFRFAKGKGDPLPHDLVVVDEASMLDITLAHALLSAVKSGSRLVLIGDADQLPPIGPGIFFRELSTSLRIPAARLTYSYRQGKDSSIAANAARINKGLGPHSYETNGDFRFVETEPEDACETVIREYVRMAETHGKQNVCCLSPMKTRSDTGTDLLNERIREILNPRAGQSEIFSKYKTLRKGDRVIQLENTAFAVNGDVGELTEVMGGYAVATFDDGREARYTEKEALSMLGLAYALTVHKAQGSEYDAAVIAVTREHTFMLQRQLLYTAVTRAREKVVIVGDAKSVGLCAARLPSAVRNSKLRERILAAVCAAGH